MYSESTLWSCLLLILLVVHVSLSFQQSERLSARNRILSFAPLQTASDTEKDDNVMERTNRVDFITFVSSNKQKVAEVKLILGEEFPWRLNCRGIDLEEPQATPIEVSQAKCKRAGKTQKIHLCYIDLYLFFISKYAKRN